MQVKQQIKRNAAEKSKSYTELAGVPLYPGKYFLKTVDRYRSSYLHGCNNDANQSSAYDSGLHSIRHCRLFERISLDTIREDTLSMLSTRI
jgi:hypothetical protein